MSEYDDLYDDELEDLDEDDDELNIYDLDNYDLDDMDDLDDLDDDELFEKESKKDDFEEKMRREREAFMQGALDGESDSNFGMPLYPFDDRDGLSQAEHDQYEMGYYSGYREDEEDWDE